MTQSHTLIQTPEPGSRHLLFQGDTITFQLSVPENAKGQAWLRTNLGHARETRREIIRMVDQNENPLGKSWYDIPMHKRQNGTFSLTLGLSEVGHFEAKAFFLAENQNEPTWPPGNNTALNVEPAETCCANSLYNAFVRQFGPNKAGKGPKESPAVKELDKAGFTVIPPSGTFRDLIEELDFIIHTLGCRLIQLLPVHPTPTTYARMGRFGSPYAALSFTAVDPALAGFDPKATPLEQFIELLDAVHTRGAKVIIDIAINHTGWAASLHETHPRWLSREPDGEIERPGAWGVTWADLTRLDYSHPDLWQYMAEIFLTWCRRGVDGFRCDAGYMVPTKAWTYIIARVRDQFPNTLFLLEGLGGKISVTRDLLNSANFNWAYSELFQNYDRGQIEHYLPEALQISETDGITIHFAETHDNLRLAATSPAYARMRTALCALLSPQGAFGFANGVEWYAAEKINVHGSPSLNWGAAENQVSRIQRLTTLLKNHPCFSHPVEIRMIQSGGGNYLVAARHHRPSGRKLVVTANLSMDEKNTASWEITEADMGNTAQLVDLISEKTVPLERQDNRYTVPLDPGQVLCLSNHPPDLEMLHKEDQTSQREPDAVSQQRLQAKALSVIHFYRGTTDLESLPLSEAVSSLRNSPYEFCRDMNPRGPVPQVVSWQYPGDVKREVMVPPGHFLWVTAPHPFRAAVIEKNRTVAVEDSMVSADGENFALFHPLRTPKIHRTRKLKISVYAQESCDHREAPLLFLAGAENASVRTIFKRPRKRLETIHVMGTNGRGGMMRAHAHWGKLVSRYDALLAANPHPDFPEDRRILLTRIRGWVVYQGFSQELSPHCLEAFGFDNRSTGYWRYSIPAGQGQHLLLTVALTMPPGMNAVQFSAYRHNADNRPDRLADDQPVSLILRPDMEDRSFHETTKAYAGPEREWPGAVAAQPDGYTFRPASERILKVNVRQGGFQPEPEWYYMVHRPQEARRGQDPDSDLFSPGYFITSLGGGGHEILTAQFHTDESKPDTAPAVRSDPAFFEKSPRRMAPVEAMKAALDQFIVKRGDFSTVIAGYPWFLDWGRDTLIVVRGIIAAGRTDDGLAIVRQFATFEENGTLPNMIRGEDTANRDTSDAPLWLFKACEDLADTTGNADFLEIGCGSRTLRRVLISIAEAMIAGTPNGIAMDPESGLLFSPAHFTWMDTNHPAGSPRQGYPIEIQALWHAALNFLGNLADRENHQRWRDLSHKVRTAILTYYRLPDAGYLSDCLHCNPGTPARMATADNALRPNQLFALTMGAVNDPDICEAVLHACQELLVPGAIRSLADRRVTPPMPIHHNGNLLNDPDHPYWGRYEDDEDTRRKPAYHNGTAWTWVFPSFCEAWAKHYGTESKAAALAWLSSSTLQLNDGCVGHVPEIVDGDYPHTRRGCDAQAWGISELLRVWLALTAT